MGWRFRKIFQSGPFRWTWTKKGVGWSIGIPGFRYGRSPNGCRYISFGIPGTGLYFIKYLDDKNRQQGIGDQPKPKVTPQKEHQPPSQEVNPTTTAKQAKPWWKEWKRDP